MKNNSRLIELLIKSVEVTEYEIGNDFLNNEESREMSELIAKYKAAILLKSLKDITLTKDGLDFILCKSCPLEAEKFVSTTRGPSGLFSSFNGYQWAIENGFEVKTV